MVGWHRFACQPGCGFNIASLVEAGAVGGLACGASIVIPHIDGDHYFQGLAFMEQELKKISRWERRRPFYQRPTARSAHNPTGKATHCILSRLSAPYECSSLRTGERAKRCSPTTFSPMHPSGPSASYPSSTARQTEIFLFYQPLLEYYSSAFYRPATGHFKCIFDDFNRYASGWGCPLKRRK